MTRWGMRFKPDPVEVSGRLIPSEDIVFAQGNVVKPNDQADWSMAFRSKYKIIFFIIIFYSFKSFKVKELYGLFVFLKYRSKDDTMQTPASVGRDLYLT
jgi:hypothetical protein